VLHVPNLELVFSSMQVLKVGLVSVGW